MNINWKVRLKNPIWWANVMAAVILPVLAHVGVNWSSVTTWQALGGIMGEALSSPVIVVAIIVSVWNAVNDPTTKGLGDSARALGYDFPSDDSKAAGDENGSADDANGKKE